MQKPCRTGMPAEVSVATASASASRACGGICMLSSVFHPPVTGVTPVTGTGDRDQSVVMPVTAVTGGKPIPEQQQLTAIEPAPSIPNGHLPAESEDDLLAQLTAGAHRQGGPKSAENDASTLA
jgi:hypothetical protein